MPSLGSRPRAGRASSSFARWALIVCLVTPATAASSVAVSALVGHQRGQHLGAGVIADQRGDADDVRVRLSWFDRSRTIAGANGLLSSLAPTTGGPAMTITCFIRYRDRSRSSATRSRRTPPNWGADHSALRRRPGRLLPAARRYQRRGLGPDRVRRPRRLRGLSRRLKADPEATREFRLRRGGRFILSEQRSFLEIVEGTFGVAAAAILPGPP